MSMKRGTGAVLTMMVLASMLTACTDKRVEPSSTIAATKAGDQKKLEPVTLKIMVPGDRPKDFDAVIQEAEKKMANSLNVKLDVVFVPWADLAQKTQVTLSSGEDIDLIFDAPWLHITQQIAAGSYEPLDGLLKQYGPNILKNRPQQMWDANKFDGKIMAIPNGNTFVQGRVYYVRKDLREQLGIAPIKTYEDLIKYAYAVKDKIPNVTPFIPAGQDVNKGLSEGAFRRYWSDNKENITPSPALSESLVLYTKNNDGKVYNLFDQMEPMVWSWIQNARKLYQDKIISPDVLAIKDINEPAKQSKAAIIPHNEFGVTNDMQQALKTGSPKAEFEAVTFMNLEKGAILTNSLQYNFIAVPVVSKHKERAIQFLDWANQKENYDLLVYGIKDKNWEAIGDDQYKFKGDSYAWFPYVWIWNPTTDRLDASQEDATKKLNKWTADASNFTIDKLSGFTFNNAAVSNEISQYVSIESKYYSALFNGVVDPDQSWVKFKAEAAPLAKKIQVEEQKQIDAFLAKK
ncbi:ABC transporter substrate-binding protein [Paenibacillus alginolyticus]|uniref:ABC transporter substrate-binding protein n=2 Tax=Paenibacillus alginolyticus TaxID=59839 RepID=UPI0003F77E8E|nr:ABC transporter substrate-binding protein [Paenibacillus alginolyticus]MCY9670726.1 ABC transporter substrate-binding protein [Paenibacillus alginolyticus]